MVIQFYIYLPPTAQKCYLIKKKKKLQLCESPLLSTAINIFLLPVTYFSFNRKLK